MFRNHIHLALRQLSKHRNYAILNILGLAIGIAAALLVYRILRYELSFNQNFDNHDRIARVILEVSGGEKGLWHNRGLPIPAMAAMETSMPLFDQMSRIREDWPTISVPGVGGGPPIKKTSPEPQGGQISYFVEPAFLNIFNLTWLAGDPTTALDKTGDIVLSRKVAEYCFNNYTDAIGKTVVLDNNVPCTVRAVFENLPVNCDFQLLSLTSFSTLRANAALYNYEEGDWGSTSSNDQFFVLLRDKNQFPAAQQALAQVGKEEFSRDNARNIKARLVLQPLEDMHYDEEVGGSSAHTISKARLWVLATIGFMVLLMACFNFINLATALASLRAREVGVRKAVGGARSTLVAQFMTETGLIVGCALLAGLTLATVCKPLLSHISEVPDSQPFLNDPAVWAFLLVTGVLVAALSGLYPSLVLSRFNPIKALRNNFAQESGGGVMLRRGLVVAQFTIAQALIIGAIVTVSQLDYVRSMDMGLRKDLILNTRFNGDSAAISRIDGLKTRLQQIAGVEQVSFASDLPTSGSTWSSNFALGRGSNDAPFSTNMKFCDADFAQTFGLEMLAGRWMAPSDTSREYVINETMCRKLGIAPASAVGMELRMGSGAWRPVVGVVKDFHTHSAHRAHEPTLLATKKDYYSSIALKIHPGSIPSTIAAVQTAFDATFPEQVFYSEFFDESLATFYRDEARFSAFCKGVAGLAVLIGCLGLFGLATHAAARRTKEIGVRKVLGASVSSITSLLTFDFLKLVVLAIVLATPVAYYAMRAWLSDFVFRIDMEWWMFVLACVGAVAVAALTVSVQSIRAAVMNPVKSLRSE
jgi:predicted permease